MSRLNTTLQFYTIVVTCINFSGSYCLPEVIMEEIVASSSVSLHFCKIHDFASRLKTGSQPETGGASRAFSIRSR